ncbi:hypothetical protein L1987_56116 [Smallanthus sonchifolius]|uniref:Uncharacterized protein n=1 Tax=Smallanthus sonchifolius TaxID=185202 RepID=A0ACB9ECX3_9ASTR|nr:hypothetical protein L1987_56116 [Smallanthus sonchifolius]
MGFQFLYLAIKIPQAITLTIISNIAFHLLSLLLAALSHVGLFKSPADPDDHPSSSGNYILLLDSSSPSLLPIPVHVITAAIKNKVPIVTYTDFVHRHGGAGTAVCTVCLDCIDDRHPIRELVNCKHVFHRECLDRWVDVGQVNCPLCRSMLLPTKKLLSAVSPAAGVAAAAANDIGPVIRASEDEIETRCRFGEERENFVEEMAVVMVVEVDGGGDGGGDGGDYGGVDGGGYGGWWRL